MMGKVQVVIASQRFYDQLTRISSAVGEYLEYLDSGQAQLADECLEDVRQAHAALGEKHWGAEQGAIDLPIVTDDR